MSGERRVRLRLRKVPNPGSGVWTWTAMLDEKPILSGSAYGWRRALDSGCEVASRLAEWVHR